MKYEPKRKWLLSIPIAGIIYIIILGFKKGWDTEIVEDESEEHSKFLGLSSSVVLLILFLVILYNI